MVNVSAVCQNKYEGVVEEFMEHLREANCAASHRSFYFLFLLCSSFLRIQKSSGRRRATGETLVLLRHTAPPARLGVSNTDYG